MSRRLSLVLLLLTGCATPRFDSVPVKRLPSSGDELIELDSRRSSGRLASRLVEVPGEADLSIFAEPTDPSAPLLIEVFRVDGSRVAHGPAPLVLKHLQADRYVIVVRLRRGATRVRLATVLALHDADARSGADALPETATTLLSGLPLRGRVDWSALDSTDHLGVVTRARGRLSVTVDLPKRKGPVAMALMAPDGTTTRLVAGAEHVIDETVEGPYVVRIRAAEHAFAEYVVTATFTAWDPDGSRDRATLLPIGDVLELRGELNPEEGDREDWFRFDLDRPALLVQERAPASSARLDWFAGNESDPVALVAEKGMQLEAGPHFIRVSGNDLDPITYATVLKLVLETTIDAAVLERSRSGGCTLVVDRGSDHRVRRGLDASVRAGDQELARGVVDTVYRNTSRVRVADADCGFGVDSTVRLRFIP